MDDLSISEDIQQHIEHCMGCLKYYKSIKKLKNDLQSLPKFTVPPNFKNNVHYAIIQHQKNIFTQYYRNKWYVHLGWAAGIIIAIILPIIWKSNLFFSPNQSPQYSISSSPEIAVKQKNISSKTESKIIKDQILAQSKPTEKIYEKKQESKKMEQNLKLDSQVLAEDKGKIAEMDELPVYNMAEMPTGSFAEFEPAEKKMREETNDTLAGSSLVSNKENIFEEEPLSFAPEIAEENQHASSQKHATANFAQSRAIPAPMQAPASQTSQPNLTDKIVYEFAPEMPIFSKKCSNSFNKKEIKNFIEDFVSNISTLGNNNIAKIIIP